MKTARLTKYGLCRAGRWSAAARGRTGTFGLHVCPSSHTQVEAIWRIFHDNDNDKNLLVVTSGHRFDVAGSPEPATHTQTRRVGANEYRLPQQQLAFLHVHVHV